MAVQLDVRDVLDQAVGGQHTVLIVAPEERDFDLLTLVLVGLVVHGDSVYFPQVALYGFEPKHVTVGDPVDAGDAAMPQH